MCAYICKSMTCVFFVNRDPTILKWKILLTKLAVTDGKKSLQPQPHEFDKLVFLAEFSQSFISLNWLSGALVGVGVFFLSVKYSFLQRADARSQATLQTGQTSREP